MLKVVTVKRVLELKNVIVAGLITRPDRVLLAFQGHTPFDNSAAIRLNNKSATICFFGTLRLDYL